MNLSFKLPCYMNSSSNEQQNVTNPTNDAAANSLENEEFQLKHVAKPAEIADSSSKIMQIVRKTGRDTD